jgi:general stress protein YciG
MDPEKRREAQRLGGLTTQRLGKAHTFTLEEMRKGGLAASRDRAYMAKIARRGGANSRNQRAKAKDQNEKGQ